MSYLSTIETSKVMWHFRESGEPTVQASVPASGITNAKNQIIFQRPALII